MKLLARVRWARLMTLTLALTCSLLAARLADQSATAEAALATASRRADLAEARAGTLQRRVEVLEGEADLLWSEKERGPGGAAEATPPPLPPIDGSVTVVSPEVEPALVLLSVGSGDGVERGFQFTVYRGSQFVAKVQVEHVMADAAACRVLFTAEGQQVRRGDSAATRLQ